MEPMVLANKIFKIKNLLEKNKAVALYVSKEWGFERWLQAELCGILNQSGEISQEVFEEGDDGKKKIDIVFEGKWAISVKDRKEDVSEVENNLEELKEPQYCKYTRTCFVFLTISPAGKNTDIDEEIKNALINNKNKVYKRDFDFMDFNFKNNYKGRIWFVVG